MKRVKHTPGPWAVHGGIEIMGDNDTTWVAKTSRNGKQDGEADARLIAAAPEMLWMLEYIYRNTELPGLTGDQVRRIENIIRKARGAE